MVPLGGISFYRVFFKRLGAVPTLITVTFYFLVKDNKFSITLKAPHVPLWMNHHLVFDVKIFKA